MKEDIFIDQEKRLLNLLYKKHGLSWLCYKLPDVTEVLSLKNIAIQVIFTFNRKEDRLFF